MNLRPAGPADRKRRKPSPKEYRADPEEVLASLESFSRLATARPLRPYQLEVGDAVVRSVLRGDGKTFSVLMARQSGKNELAAQLEAYLLHRFAQRGGQIVKAAPSYSPQIVNSRLRLEEILSHPFSFGRWSPRYGHSIELDQARIMFFSTSPAANVVGATASILLAVDEAQDVDEDVYWRSFRPMAATTRATTVLYGTAWDEDNILEKQRRYNREREERDGERCNFEFAWPTLAALSPEYQAFVSAEIERLGEDHPSIRTQYLLEPVSSIGRLFSPELLARMHGDHERRLVPEEGVRYVAGVDVAGQVVQAGLTVDARVLNDRDETVVTVASVDLTHSGDRSGLPLIRVVDHHRWRGLSHFEQYQRLLSLMRDTWNVNRVAVDATGVGAGLASFLLQALSNRTDAVVFTTRSKSDLGFALLAAAETGRLKVYREDGGDTLQEFWRQLSRTRYRLRGSEEMEFCVPSAEGHDDFVMSLALTVRAAEAGTMPAFGGLVRSLPDPDDLAVW